MESVAPRGSSRTVRGQRGLHPRLAAVVRKHLDSPDRTPIPGHTQEAFEAVADRIATDDAAIVFDSGCGTGHSTAKLARRHPNAWVVGIDKSIARLGRGPGARRPWRRSVCQLEARTLLVRADTFAFWRLAAAAQWRLTDHYILYPNPWPKAAHLKRRIHGHPAFSALARLGGGLEVRTNWRVYADELREALLIAGMNPKAVMRFSPQEALTPFESKYVSSAHSLWRITAESQPSVTP